MDVFIVFWDFKMYYDFVCFYVLIYDYYCGKEIIGWVGLGKGFVKMKGEEWCFYFLVEFFCLFFLSYVFGYSMISGVCVEVLCFFIGSD